MYKATCSSTENSHQTLYKIWVHVQRFDTLFESKRFNFRTTGQRISHSDK